jgi:FkbM family methyltransferase
MNDLELYQPLIDALTPWAGEVPQGYAPDFMGVLTDVRFYPLSGIQPSQIGGGHMTTTVPTFSSEPNGEWWFETVNWLVAARDARSTFVMITLGANYGAQAVSAHRALQMVNPLPCKLVAVEPVPENYEWICRHFRDNGIDPDAHWLVPMAIGDSNAPVLFPVGGAGVGSNNSFSTNEFAARVNYADALISGGETEAALRNLLLHNTTGIMKDLVPGRDYKAEIKLVSCITLRDLLGPFDRVDYLEADIQQSEILVFPPFIDLLRKKVRRIHIGTHGGEVHAELHALFETGGWEIVFSYAPNQHFDSPIGPFDTNDGVLTVRNPDL